MLPPPPDAALPLVQEPMSVLAVLLGLLALLFWINAHPRLGRIFKAVPLLVFAYFLPTALSNSGLIPIESSLYDFVKTWLLPASLLLLTLAVDVKGIARLGRLAVLMFLGATLSIVIGGPLAYLIGGALIPEELQDQAWRGLAALAGSWIGGGANFVAIGEAAETSDSTLSLMVVVDVAVANVWMAVLLWFAGREKEMDARMGADRSAIDEVRRRVEDYQASVARPLDLSAALWIGALGFGGAALAQGLARWEHMPTLSIPGIGDVVSGFTWVVLIVTVLGLALSFTRLRALEGAGASRIGSAFLYLLVTTIGAKAEFHRVFDPQNLGIVVIGAIWMLLHAIILLLLRRWLKAPIFFLAVGSQANVGGAASAPIVAAAFHPALAPVGVLLAVGGYVLGTVCGLLTMVLLKLLAT